MTSGADAPLTRTAFRRDVRLFLTGLVGFLILLILLLLLFLRVDLDRTEKTIDRSEATIADIVERHIDAGAARAPFDEARRVTRAGTLILRFDGSERAAARRRFLLTA